MNDEPDKVGKAMDDIGFIIHRHLPEFAHLPHTLSGFLDAAKVKEIADGIMVEALRYRVEIEDIQQSREKPEGGRNPAAENIIGAKLLRTFHKASLSLAQKLETLIIEIYAESITHDDTLADEKEKKRRKQEIRDKIAGEIGGLDIMHTPDGTPQDTQDERVQFVNKVFGEGPDSYLEDHWHVSPKEIGKRVGQEVPEYLQDKVGIDVTAIIAISVREGLMDAWQVLHETFFQSRGEDQDRGSREK